MTENEYSDYKDYKTSTKGNFCSNVYFRESIYNNFMFLMLILFLNQIVRQIIV